MDRMEKLDRRVLDWVAANVRPGAAVTSADRLYGGVSSVVHAVTLQDGDEKIDVVLRRITDQRWLREEPDVALREAESLRLAAAMEVDTPRLIAVDETGDRCGHPAVVMSRLAGAVVLQPADLTHWLDGLAEALVRMHGASIPIEEHRWDYRAYTDESEMHVPAWSAAPEAWASGIAAARGPQPAFEPRFIHRDYHPANVLWDHGVVSGVVDWVNGCRGPAGIDVGHCRVNLARLHGVEAADAFLGLYRMHAAAAGADFAYDPYWDIRALLDMGEPEVYAGWTDLGATGLSDALIRERTDAYMASLAARLG
jgi:aminoglycoside phosphotransferase (APT) family kinase protein